MDHLKQTLLNAIATIDQLEIRPSVVAGGVELFCRNKSIGHFHSDHELDLKLSKKVIQTQGLQHSPHSLFHPKRTTNSPWIEIRFFHQDDIERVVTLIKIAMSLF